MAAFLCKFHGRLSPHGIRVPRNAAEWEGGVVNVPQPRRSTAGSDNAPMMAVGDTVYLWVHDTQEGSHGAGLTAKARIQAVENRGRDDVDLRISQVTLIRPFVKYHQFQAASHVRSAVGDRLNYALRQSLHIADADVAEWERHYGWFAEQIAAANARALVEQHRAALSRENQERFREVRARPAQGAFRASVIEQHNSRCAISGECTLAVLEAAHVLNFAQHPKYRSDPRNGILLRVDLHRLFDAGLLSVDKGRVALSPQLRGTSYAALAGKAVTTSADPSFLAQHHQDATAENGQMISSYEENSASL